MYSLSFARKMIAPGPTSWAPNLATCGLTSSLAVPRVMVRALPSMKRLSFLAIGRVVSCAWAKARLDTLDVKAIVVATMIADLHLVLVILFLLLSETLVLPWSDSGQ